MKCLKCFTSYWGWKKSAVQVNSSSSPLAWLCVISAGMNSLHTARGTFVMCNVSSNIWHKTHHYFHLLLKSPYKEKIFIPENPLD